MSFVNNFQSMTSDQAKKMVSDLLDTRAIDAIADMKNEATAQLDEATKVNSITHGEGILDRYRINVGGMDSHQLNQIIDKSAHEDSWAIEGKGNRYAEEDGSESVGFKEARHRSIASRVLKDHFKQKEKSNKPAKEATAQLDEAFTVHVRSYSSKPDKKDTDHVKSGVELHNGVYDGASDKGSYFKFKTESEAKKFKSHVDKSPNKTVAGDLQED